MGNLELVLGESALGAWPITVVQRAYLLRLCRECDESGLNASTGSPLHHDVDLDQIGLGR